MLVDLGAFPALIPGDGSGVLGSPSKRSARLDLASVMFVGGLPQRIHGSTHNLQIDGHFRAHMGFESYTETDVLGPSEKSGK